MTTDVANGASAGEGVVVGVPYAGFWRRVGADFVDSLVLGVVGQLLGLVLAEKFVRLGNAGWLVGLVIAGAYLIPSYGAWMNGQSLGKRVLGLRVQGVDGHTIGPIRAALRYLVLALPLLLNGVYFAIATPTWFVWIAGIVLVTIVFGGIIGNTYLMIFNRPSRRLVHDFAAGTVVVRTGSKGVAELVPLRKLHAFVLLGLSVVAVCSLTLAGKLAASYAPQLAQLQRMHDAIAAMPGVVGVAVNDVTQTSKGASAESLQLRVWLARWPVAPEALADDYFARAHQVFPELDALDRVTVTVSHGFNIGIASRWQNSGYSHTPIEWQQRIVAPK